MTPLNLEATPFIASASPGLSIGLPQVIWDPVLGVWQPCSDELGTSSANLSALTPLSESSSTTLAKPVNALIFQLSCIFHSVNFLDFLRASSSSSSHTKRL